MKTFTYLMISIAAVIVAITGLVITSSVGYSFYHTIQAISSRSSLPYSGKEREELSQLRWRQHGVPVNLDNQTSHFFISNRRDINEFSINHVNEVKRESGKVGVRHTRKRIRVLKIHSRPIGDTSDLFREVRFANDRWLKSSPDSEEDLLLCNSTAIKQVYLEDIETGEVKELTDRPGAIFTAHLSNLSDSRAANIIYVAANTDTNRNGLYGCGDEMKVFSYNYQSGESKEVFMPGPLIWFEGSSRGGHIILGIGVEKNGLKFEIGRDSVLPYRLNKIDNTLVPFFQETLPEGQVVEGYGKIENDDIGSNPPLP